VVLETVVPTVAAVGELIAASLYMKYINVEIYIIVGMSSKVRLQQSITAKSMNDGAIEWHKIYVMDQ
jgi:hypothetical protein